MSFPTERVSWSSPARRFALFHNVHTSRLLAATSRGISQPCSHARCVHEKAAVLLLLTDPRPLTPDSLWTPAVASGGRGGHGWWVMWAGVCVPSEEPNHGGIGEKAAAGLEHLKEGGGRGYWLWRRLLIHFCHLSVVVGWQWKVGGRDWQKKQSYFI